MTPKQVRAIIEQHKKSSASDRARWDKFKGWYRSQFWGPDEELPQGAGDIEDTDAGRFETNYLYAYIDTMVANVCPLNPQVSVNARRPETAPLGRVRSALIDIAFEANKAHEKLWQLVTKASVYQRSFMKALWDQRGRKPKFRVIDPHHVFFDMTAETWEDVRYVIEVTVRTKEEFYAFAYPPGDAEPLYNPEVAEKANFDHYPKWLRDTYSNPTGAHKAAEDVLKWVVVYEVYDFTGPGKFYHFLDECDEPLFEGELPYRFVRNPFYLFTVNESLEDIGGLGDADLIEGPQEQLNEIDTLELAHAKTSIPSTAVQRGLLENPEQAEAALKNSSQPGSIIFLDAGKKARASDLIMQTPTPTLSPSFDKMRARSTETIEFTLGLPQFSRGVVGITDVATEAALADNAHRTRNGRRQKRVTDVQGWMGKVTVGLYEEFLDEKQALYARLTDDEDIIEITRASAGFVDLKAEAGESPLEFDYVAVPYSSMENNRLVQLRNIRENWDVLQLGIQQGVYDGKKIFRKIAELLMMDNILANPRDAGQQQQQIPGAGPPSGAGPMPPTPTEDTVATGAMPAGAEPAAVATGAPAAPESPAVTSPFPGGV